MIYHGSVRGLATFLLVTASFLGSTNVAFARCPSVAFPDTSSLGPLPPLASGLDALNLASIAGLRTLEFGTNFQRRSANLIGQNPLIIASNDDAIGGGGAAGDENELASKLGVLVTGFGAVGNEQSSSLNTDIDWTTRATAISVDYAINPNLFVGAMVGASRVTGCSAPQDNFTTPGSVNVISNGVSGDFQVVSLFGIFETEGYYLDTIASLGTGEFDFGRAQTVNGLRAADGNVILERVNEVVIASTDSSLLRASIAGGLKRQFGLFDVSPYGRFSYAQVTIDGYREELDLANSPGHPAPESGGGFALRLTDQTVESLTTGAGVGVSRVFSTPIAVISLKADFEWVHEFNDTSKSVLSALAGFSSGTIANSALAQRFPERQLDSDYFYLGAGISAVLIRGFQLFGNVQALLGYEDVQETHAAFGLRYEF